MSQHSQRPGTRWAAGLASVSDLADFQARRPHTIILQVSNVRSDGEVHRHVGVNDALTFHELHGVLATCFGLGAESSPWAFFVHVHARGERIDPGHNLREFITRVGDQLDYTWGLWDFTIQAADIYPRDADTPQALCIGGSGAFQGRSFDLTEINSRLTGQDTIDAVLGTVAGGARSVISRSKLFDFVPLLQAMDLNREPEVDASVARQLASLPREVTTEGTDAFWSTVLGLACMSDDETTNTVAETTMVALGWHDESGKPLSAAQVRDLCSSSLRVLSDVGGAGPSALPPVDRLDVYRALLRGA